MDEDEEVESERVVVVVLVVFSCRVMLGSSADEDVVMVVLVFVRGGTGSVKLPSLSGISRLFEGSDDSRDE